MELVKAAFRHVTLPAEYAWQTVLILLKGNFGYIWISLIEVLWKAMLGLIKFIIGVVVCYHEALHDFRSGRGTETASLEANLLQ